MFHLIHNTDLEVTFDMSGVSDHIPTVAFDIFVKWTMPSQELSLNVKECWFDCEKFDDFEGAVRQLISKDNGSIILHDLSNNPVISLTKSGEVLITEMYFQDTLDRGSFTLNTKSRSIELSEIRDKLGAFDKWW
jgi:hypothetical protein